MHFAPFNKIESNNNVIIAYSGEEPVGCGCYRTFDEKTVEIKRMYVKPEFRGSGVSRQILSEIEKLAIENGFTKAVLETGVKQPEAIRFYEKQGYGRMDNFGPYIGSTSNLCMFRQLNARGKNYRILILKNIPRENPGILEEILVEKQIPFDKVEIADIQQIADISSYTAIVVLGGPASANDHDDHMLYELDLIRQAIKDGIPYLGICLGLQTLVKAMGGSVEKTPVPEIGFRDPDGEIFSVELTREGKTDPLFKNLQDRFRVFELHGEMVIPTDGMCLLATGKFCRNQVVRVGENAYGIQCHFELNEELLEEWIIEDSDLMKLDASKLRADFRALGKEYNETGKQLFTNFLKIADLI